MLNSTFVRRTLWACAVAGVTVVSIAYGINLVAPGASKHDVLITGSEVEPILPINDSATSPDGNYVYVVGSIPNSDGTSTRGPGQTYASGSSFNLFVAKYDSSGTRVTALADNVTGTGTAASNPPDVGNAVVVDPSGNLYVTGQAGTQLFVRKYSSSLATLATYFYPSSRVVNGVARQVTSMGRKLALSTEGGTAYLYVVGEEATQSVDAGPQLVNLKLDCGTLTASWANIFTASGTSTALRVGVSTDNGTSHVYSAARNSVTTNGVTTFSAIVVSYDTNGGLVFGTTIGAASLTGTVDDVKDFQVSPSGSDGLFLGLRLNTSAGTVSAIASVSKGTGSVVGYNSVAGSYEGLALDPATALPILVTESGEVCGPQPGQGDVKLTKFYANPSQGIVGQSTTLTEAGYWEHITKVIAGPTELYLVGYDTYPQSWRITGYLNDGTPICLLGPTMVPNHRVVIAVDPSALSEVWSSRTFRLTGESYDPLLSGYSQEIAVSPSGGVFGVFRHGEVPSTTQDVQLDVLHF